MFLSGRKYLTKKEFVIVGSEKNMKTKVVLVIISMLLSMLVVVGMTTGEQEELVPNTEVGAKITIETNKLHYAIGETVGITYTNVGDAVAGFVIGTARSVIPWIIEAETEEILFLTDPTLCHPYVMMYGILEPSDSFTVKWDQQYYGYYGDTFTPSEQVPEGLYFVELGYWEVIGEYDPPYMVPGGPPDHYAISKFSISGIFSHTKI